MDDDNNEEKDKLRRSRKGIFSQIPLRIVTNDILKYHVYRVNSNDSKEQTFKDLVGRFKKDSTETKFLFASSLTYTSRFGPTESKFLNRVPPKLWDLRWYIYDNLIPLTDKVIKRLSTLTKLTVVINSTVTGTYSFVKKLMHLPFLRKFYLNFIGNQQIINEPFEDFIIPRPWPMVVKKEALKLFSVKSDTPIELNVSYLLNGLHDLQLVKARNVIRFDLNALMPRKIYEGQKVIHNVLGNLKHIFVSSIYLDGSLDSFKNMDFIKSIYVKVVHPSSVHTADINVLEKKLLTRVVFKGNISFVGKLDQKYWKNKELVILGGANNYIRGDIQPILDYNSNKPIVIKGSRNVLTGDISNCKRKQIHLEGDNNTIIGKLTSYDSDGKYLCHHFHLRGNNNEIVFDLDKYKAKTKLHKTFFVIEGVNNKITGNLTGVLDQFNVGNTIFESIKLHGQGNSISIKLDRLYNFRKFSVLGRGNSFQIKSSSMNLWDTMEFGIQFENKLGKKNLMKLIRPRGGAAMHATCQLISLSFDGECTFTGNLDFNDFPVLELCYIRGKNNSLKVFFQDTITTSLVQVFIHGNNSVFRNPKLYDTVLTSAYVKPYFIMDPELLREEIEKVVDSPFEFTSNLHFVNVNLNAVERATRKLTSFSMVNVNNRFYGDVNSFSKFVNLKKILIEGNDNVITGSIKAFKNVHSLTSLELYGKSNELTGDIHVFVPMKNLKILILHGNNNKLTGDISSLSQKYMTIVVLKGHDSNKLTGDISGLKMDKMKKFLLFGVNNKFNGSISKLKFDKSLRKFGVGGDENKIKGNIAVFKELPLLKSITFRGTKNTIVGDIATFKSSKKIKWVHLEGSNNKIRGNMTYLVNTDFIERVKIEGQDNGIICSLKSTKGAKLKLLVINGDNNKFTGTVFLDRFEKFVIHGKNTLAIGVWGGQKDLKLKILDVHGTNEIIEVIAGETTYNQYNHYLPSILPLAKWGVIEPHISFGIIPKLQQAVELSKDTNELVVTFPMPLLSVEFVKLLHENIRRIVLSSKHNSLKFDINLLFGPFKFLVVLKLNGIHNEISAIVDDQLCNSLSALKVLELEGKNLFVTGDIKCFAKMEHLKSLKIVGANVELKGDIAKAFRTNYGMLHIELGGPNSAFVGNVFIFKRLTALRTCIFRGNNRFVGDVQFVENMTNLQSCILEGFHNKLSCKKGLKIRSKQLRHLEFYGNSNTIKGNLKELEYSPVLESFVIRGYLGKFTGSFDTFGKLKSLRTFDSHQNDIISKKSDIFSFLTLNSPSLRVFTINDHSPVKFDFGNFKRLSNLQVFEVDTMEYFGDLRNMSFLINLKVLDISEPKVPIKGELEIRSPFLKSLHIRGDGNSIRGNIEQFRRTPNLKIFEIKGSLNEFVGDVGVLSTLSKLNTFKLFGNNNKLKGNLILPHNSIQDMHLGGLRNEIACNLSDIKVRYSLYTFVIHGKSNKIYGSIDMAFKTKVEASSSHFILFGEQNKLSGDISSIVSKGTEEIYLEGKRNRFTGDLAVLDKSQSFRSVHVEGDSNVFGGNLNLINHSKLKKCVIYGTNNKIVVTLPSNYDNLRLLVINGKYNKVVFNEITIPNHVQLLVEPVLSTEKSKIKTLDELKLLSEIFKTEKQIKQFGRDLSKRDDLVLWRVKEKEIGREQHEQQKLLSDIFKTEKQIKQLDRELSKRDDFVLGGLKEKEIALFNSFVMNEAIKVLKQIDKQPKEKFTVKTVRDMKNVIKEIKMYTDLISDDVKEEVELKHDKFELFETTLHQTMRQTKELIEKLSSRISSWYDKVGRFYGQMDVYVKKTKIGVKKLKDVMSYYTPSSTIKRIYDQNAKEISKLKLELPKLRANLRSTFLSYRIYTPLEETTRKAVLEKQQLLKNLEEKQLELEMSLMELNDQQRKNKKETPPNSFLRRLYTSISSLFYKDV